MIKTSQKLVAELSDEELAAKLDRMFLVLLKCRDALPAITDIRAELYNVPLDLDKQIEAEIEPWKVPDGTPDAL